MDIYSNDYNIGCHVSFTGLEKTISRSVSNGLYVIQFFMGNPKSFKRYTPMDGEIQKVNKILERFPMSVISHYPYISNLAGSKHVLAWSGCESQDVKTRKIIIGIEHELRVLSSLKSDMTGIVIHPGNHIDSKSGLQTISKSINKITFQGNTRLLLENSCGSGTGLASTLEEIRYIIDGVDDHLQKHIGVCIDTAHIFGKGLYDLRKISGVDKLFSDFKNIIGLNKFNLLHLNDSRISDSKGLNAPFASCKDRHAPIGEGYIWKNNHEPLIHLLEKCKLYGIPIVLETPNPLDDRRHINFKMNLKTI